MPPPLAPSITISAGHRRSNNFGVEVDRLDRLRSDRRGIEFLPEGPAGIDAQVSTAARNRGHRRNQPKKWRSRRAVRAIDRVERPLSLHPRCGQLGARGSTVEQAPRIVAGREDTLLARDDLLEHWRSMSMSAPFSASSASAIVALVIVESPSDRLVGCTSTLSGATMATPEWGSPSPRGKPLRATPYASCRDERLTPLAGTSTAEEADGPDSTRRSKPPQVGSPQAAGGPLRTSILFYTINP